MPPAQSKEKADDSSKLNQQQLAQLQVIGIDLFSPVAQIDVAQQPWIDDICKLLNISRSDCLFDAKQPSFDDKLNKLHLPAFSSSNESDIKRLIWRNIRRFVN